MTALFFYGTLRDPDLLRIVMGPEWDYAVIVPAMLPDHAVDWASGQTFPTLTPERGKTAEGICVTGLSDSAVARFDFYEGSFGYRLRKVEVTLDGSVEAALVYFPDAGLWERGAPFDLEEWQARFAPLARLSAIEEMSYFGQISGEELSRRLPMIRARAAARLAAAEGVPADIRSARGADEVERISHERAHAGFFVTDIHELRYPAFAGGMGPVVRREIFVATDAAIVLPYDPARDRVLLVEQFRMGPYGRGDPRPWMLEPVAGRVDPGETPEECARRECAEEAGIALTSLEHIASFYVTPGTSTEYFHAYIGLCDLPDTGRGTGGLDSEHEDIRTHVLSFDAAQHLLSTGEADNGPLVLALVWLAQARDRLRAR